MGKKTHRHRWRTLNDGTQVCMNPSCPGHLRAFAPSEEFILHCDVPGCPASVSMVAGIPRSAHGWGRVSLYEDALVRDYDLCAEHYLQVTAILWGA